LRGAQQGHDLLASDTKRDNNGEDSERKLLQKMKDPASEQSGRQHLEINVAAEAQQK
jgi:hypothetical protein